MSTHDSKVSLHESKSMPTIFLDTETVGLTSPLISIQVGAPGERPIFYNVWTHPVQQTLNLIEFIVDHRVIAWNLVFDWFQLTKWYNIFFAYHSQYPNGDPPDVRLVWEIERSHPDTLCLRPLDALDLMIYARKGPFQHLMKFKDVRIRGIPVLYAYELIDLIMSKTKLPVGSSIKVTPIKNDKRPDVVDLKVSFIGSTSLKFIHKTITGEETLGTWADFFDTKEFGTPYKPWGGEWVSEIEDIQRRGVSGLQQQYALKDIRMLEEIWNHFGQPDGDVDSQLTCCVGATRWRGYSVDLDVLNDAWEDRDLAIPMAPDEVKHWLGQKLDSMEQLMLTDTKKETLRRISKFETPGSKYAGMVLTERQNASKRQVIAKLREAEAFYPELKVSGTLTNRMSGGGLGKAGGSINPQGISKSPEIRRGFTFAFTGEVFSGGDFKAFEISIMDAVWGDPTIHSELLTGKKMIALFGSRIYNKSYEEVLQSDKLGEGSMYDRAKKAFYARAYGGQAKKLSEVLGLSLDETVAKLNYFDTSYANIGKHNQEVLEAFTMLRNWVWVEPKPYIETILGYRRSFTLEQAFARGLYDTLRALPQTWSVIVRRKDKAQPAWQACTSALYGAIRQLEARIIRVAGNCEIQSPGAELNKILQNDIWMLQPAGISMWHVRPMNVHDEQCVAHLPPMDKPIRETVEKFVTRMRAKVPLLAVDWKSNLGSWEDK